MFNEKFVFFVSTEQKKKKFNNAFRSGNNLQKLYYKEKKKIENGKKDRLCVLHNIFKMPIILISIKYSVNFGIYTEFSTGGHLLELFRRSATLL